MRTTHNNDSFVWLFNFAKLTGGPLSPGTPTGPSCPAGPYSEQRKFEKHSTINPKCRGEGERANKLTGGPRLPCGPGGPLGPISP